MPKCDINKVALQRWKFVKQRPKQNLSLEGLQQYPNKMFHQKKQFKLLSSSRITHNKKKNKENKK